MRGGALLTRRQGSAPVDAPALPNAVLVGGAPGLRMGSTARRTVGADRRSRRGVGFAVPNAVRHCANPKVARLAANALARARVLLGVPLPRPCGPDCQQCRAALALCRAAALRGRACLRLGVVLPGRAARAASETATGRRDRRTAEAHGWRLATARRSSRESRHRFIPGRAGGLPYW